MYTSLLQNYINFTLQSAIEESGDVLELIFSFDFLSVILYLVTEYS